MKDLNEPIKISYGDQKSIDICKSYEVKSVRKLVLGIFQAALGEFEFLNYYESNIEILWGHNSQYSSAPYLFNTYISQMTYLGMAALQTAAQNFTKILYM